MCDAIQHRGPDEHGAHHVPGKIALGFQRLAIIDLETGSQPLFNEGGTVAVTCNGEIYNFQALRASLETRGHRFQSRSDAEVIVHLYEEHGPDCLHHLQGMFAIALWDAERGRLLLARDRLGVKPMYWVPLNGGGLAYGSEPAALLAAGFVEREPDPSALMQFLTLQYVPAPRTAFLGMRKLRPGERLIFEDGAYKIDRWWRLPDPRPKAADAENAVAEVDELLGDATRSRLTSDVPLGALLSGGIDSSLVVSYMAEALPRVQTFSIDFPEVGYSEGRHARLVSDLCGTDHHELVFEPEMVPAAAAAVGRFGEPFADPSAVPTYVLSELTRHCVTVALSGDGGDEAFGGYWRYRRAYRADRLGPPARVAARVLRPLGRRIHLRGRGADLSAILDTVAEAPHDRYAGLVGDFQPSILERLCLPEFVDAAGGTREAWDSVLALPRHPSPDRYMVLDAQTYLPDDVLVKVDRASMAHALEVRSPFLDFRIYELSMRLSSGLKLRGSTTKWLLRELARRRRLPEEIAARGKRGFGMPIGHWLRGQLRSWAVDLLTDGRLAQRGYFAQAEIERMLGDHLVERADHARAIWTLAMLEIWHRNWIDGASRRSFRAPVVEATG